MRVRGFNLSTITLLSLLLIFAFLADGCANSRTQKRRPRDPGNEQGDPGDSGNDNEWGGADEPGDGNPIGMNGRGLPDLNYETRTANPNPNVADGAGSMPEAENQIVTIVVDQNNPQASDSNTGTAAAPVKSIKRGFQLVKQNARSGNFIHLKIHEGVYREELYLSTGMQSNSRLLIEGIGEVVLSGAEIYSDWQSAGSGRYEHEWNFDWGLFTETEEWLNASAQMKSKHKDWILQSGDLFKRREIVVVNGDIMRQVLNQGEIDDGSYFVDEPGNRIVLDPPNGVSINEALVEVGERWQIMQLQRCPNTTVRNITFQHAATMVEQRAVWIRGCDNILLDNCRFNDNNFRGLGLYSCDRASMRNCEANHNGTQGVDIAFISNLLIADCETNDNNWRGDWANTYAWAIGGIKILNTANTIVRGHEAVDNLTFGIWFDHDNLHVLVENSVMNGNHMDGMFLEATRGPILVRNCTMNENTLGGVRIANAERITLQDNHIENNGRFQIYMRGYGRMVDTRVTGLEEKMEYSELTFTGNTIIAESANQMLFWTNLDQQQMEIFLETSESDYNTWIHPNPDACIQVSSKLEPYGFDVWRRMVEGSHSTIHAEQ
jgi:parallel beta-helix repeat protein